MCVCFFFVFFFFFGGGGGGSNSQEAVNPSDLRSTQSVQNSCAYVCSSAVLVVCILALLGFCMIMLYMCMYNNACTYMCIYE